MITIARLVCFTRVGMSIAVALQLSGCVGIGFGYPGTLSESRVAPMPGFSLTSSGDDYHRSKANFTAVWGKPDVIIPTNNGEIWRYYHGLDWAGVMPMVLIPIPLLLPVKRARDDVHFVDDRAENVSYSIIQWIGGCYCPNNEGEMKYGFRAMQ